MADFFATCPKGLESILAAELSGLGASDIKETVAGVAYTTSEFFHNFSILICST